MKKYYAIKKAEYTLPSRTLYSFDFEGEAFESVGLDSGNPAGYRREARVNSKIPDLIISPQPGVRFAHIYFEAAYYVVMFSRQILNPIGSDFEDSINHVRDARIQIGKNLYEYSICNLNYVDMLYSGVVFERSRFNEIDSREFHIHGTRVSRGQNEVCDVKKLFRGMPIISGTGDYLDRKRSGEISMLYPESLCIELELLPAIINLGARLTLFREDVINKIRRIDNSGLVFPWPVIDVFTDTQSS